MRSLSPEYSVKSPCHLIREITYERIVDNFQNRTTIFVRWVAVVIYCNQFTMGDEADKVADVSTGYTHTPLHTSYTFAFTLRNNQYQPNSL